MHTHASLRSPFKWLAPCIAAATVAVALVACGGSDDNNNMTAAPGQSFVATNLVSDTNASSNPYASANVDANLVNGWGIAFNPTGFVWVADAGTSMSTLYDGNGVPQSLIVAIPAGTAGAAHPTGIVFNSTTGFQVTQAGVTGASPFIFSSIAGTISGWSPSVNRTSSITMFDGAAQGKSYRGLAIATQGANTFIYATDFHNAAVDVFDSTFAPVTIAGAFVDANLPAGYAPFGIQAIGNQLYVSYAKQDAAGVFQVTGAGLGAVDIFDTSGTLVKRLILPGGALNAAWGMAMAPASFGPFSNDLLVGNFGDGKINAFDPTTGALLGSLTLPNGVPIAIDGLWGIAFGNGIDSQPTTTLFYAAGPASETHGVYGRIDNQ
jgi:uncharacterized protein (TIGR03118 family)